VLESKSACFGLLDPIAIPQSGWPNRELSAITFARSIPWGRLVLARRPPRAASPLGRTGLEDRS